MEIYSKAKRAPVGGGDGFGAAASLGLIMLETTELERS